MTAKKRLDLGPAPVATPQWRAANNGTGKRIWFLIRETPGQPAEYHYGANDRLVRYGSYEAARTAADRLNQSESAPAAKAQVIVELTIDTAVMSAHLKPDAEWLLASQADTIARLMQAHLRSHIMGREISYTVYAKPGFKEYRAPEAGTR